MLFNFESLNFHSFDCYFTFLQYVNRYLKTETTSLKNSESQHNAFIFVRDECTALISLSV